MQIFYTHKGTSIHLLDEIGGGGEGAVWKTNLTGYVAKIYTSPDAEKKKKIEAMLENPPENPTASSNHIAISWPSEMLKDNSNNFVGFLMPYIQDSVDLKYVCNPSLRKEKLPRFDWRYLHITAKNLAWLIHKIHEKGYILGDISVKNLFVNNRALVSVIDTDSFQLQDRDGKLYRCQVGSEGFTPPELIDKRIPDIAQTRAHDYFRLGLLIHHLLFGMSPFAGEWKGEGDMPTENELIHQGIWPYAPNSKLKQSSRTIPLEVVHPSIKDLFLRCFNEGYTNSSQRPTAKEWYEALDIAIKDLINCTQVENHVYSKTYGMNYSQCYWCYRAKNLGTDVFAISSTSPSSRRPSSSQTKSASSNAHSPQKSSTQSTPTSSNNGTSKGCLIWLGVFIFVIILIAVVSNL